MAVLLGIHLLQHLCKASEEKLPTYRFFSDETAFLNGSNLVVNTFIQLQSYHIWFILYIYLLVLLKMPWPFVLLTSYSEK